MNPTTAETARAEIPWVTARPTRFTEALVRTVLFPRVIVRHWDLIWTTVKRELEARFTGTLLGWLWPLVHPLFLFCVYYFVFANLLNMKFPDLPDGYEASMGVFMFVGIAAFAAHAETVVRGTGVITDNGNLIKKLAFPSEVLPLNLTIANAVTLCFTLAVFLLACALTPMWPFPGISVLWIAPILFVQMMFTFGLALFLSTLHVFLRDTIQFVGMFMTAWMFATPLFWSPELTLDAEMQERWMPLITANPLYHAVAAWRGALMGDLVVGGTAYVSTADIGHHLLVFLPWAVGSYVIGHVFFVLSQRRFADEV
ncbi:MAG: ABC transporter permease [Planctomycetota bacterium]